MTEPSESQEVELKLALAPEFMAKVQRAPVVRRHQDGRARTRNLNAVYFDTAGQDLKKRRVAVRIRKEGRDWIQCIKQTLSSRGGIMRRDELETVLRSPQLDLDVLRDSRFKGLISDEEARGLQRLFETRVKRNSRTLVFDDGTRVQMDTDLGDVVTRNSQSPISEVELELKTGNPAHLYDVALALAESAPLRVSLQTKAARGFALANGGGTRWHRATAPKPTADETIEDVISQIVDVCLYQLISNETCVLERAHIEGIHQMRVASRRLRSALSLFSKILPAEQVAYYGGELKWLIGELGAARDWDVFNDEILAGVLSKMAENEALQAISKAAEGKRVAAYERAETAIMSPRYTKLLLGIGRWVHTRDWRNQPVSEAASLLVSPIGRLSDSLLSAHYKKLRKRGKGFARLSVEDRHRVRIAVKKMRYAIEFLGALYPTAEVKTVLSPLKGMQDGLGLLNDIAVMEGLLAELRDGLKPAEARKAALGSGILIGWQSHLLTAKESQMVAAWKMFTKAPVFWDGAFLE